MPRSTVALDHARAAAIVLVVGVHATLAYLQYQPVTEIAFTQPPYAWRVIPIVDQQHWLGFDLYSGLLYALLMPFMFFLSGLFVWPSLSRRGTWGFLRDRSMRLGIPFVVGVYVLMPLAYFPAFRLSAANSGWSAFRSAWSALPFSPGGPLWFLWQILAFDVMAAAFFALAPAAGRRLAHGSRQLNDFPGRYCVALAAVTAISYVPLAAIFTPWDLEQVGPFAYFPSRLLYFAVYFFAGVGVGMNGIDAAWLRAAGTLARQWAPWWGVTLAATAAWLVLTAVTIGNASLGIGTVPHAEIVANLVFAVASSAGTLAFAAVFLRFAAGHWPAGKSLSDNAYGIYLTHYPFVVWLQYLLVGTAVRAPAKGAIVWGGSLLASWAATSALRRTSIGSVLIGAARRRPPAVPPQDEGGIEAAGRADISKA